MYGDQERAEARASVDLVLKEAQPGKWATDKKQLDASERRVKFWRDRCLEHARTIDVLQKQIHALRALPTEGQILNVANRFFTEGHDICEFVWAVFSAREGALCFMPSDDEPTSGSNPNPPECDPRA